MPAAALRMRQVTLRPTSANTLGPPPTQLTNDSDTDSVEVAVQRSEDHLEGNGTTVATRRAKASVHAGQPHLTSDI